MKAGPSIKPFLELVTASPEREAQWLDLLSQLEYVGARKILKGVRFDRIDAGVLQHAAEEASHAWLLKEAAERLGRTGATWDSPLSQLAWRYFRELDTQISALQEEGHYPAVSWAIERRVMEVYPAYVALTRDPGVRTALQQILAQEKRHGAQFDAVELPAEVKRKAALIEEELWDEFHSCLMHAFSHS
jgi:hypothetical protein